MILLAPRTIEVDFTKSSVKKKKKRNKKENEQQIDMGIF